MCVCLFMYQSAFADVGEETKTSLVDRCESRKIRLLHFKDKNGLSSKEKWGNVGKGFSHSSAFYALA